MVKVTFSGFVCLCTLTNLYQHLPEDTDRRLEGCTAVWDCFEFAASRETPQQRHNNACFALLGLFGV